MGILNNWPFVKRDELARRDREFDERIFPLGFDAQREKMKETLADLIPTPASKMQYLLFACLLAKDKYLQSDQTEEGLLSAKKVIDKVLRNTEEEKLLILTLARMDSNTFSLDEYPTPEQVRKEAGL
jgi:hypothetical protein